jgi:thiol-disulfide isomerase/thioredoxin
MDKKTSNKTTTVKPKQPQNESKQPQNQNATQKKEKNKLNPVKPKGKANEAEKKSLRQARESQPVRNNRKKNTKREKKEVEKELYLRFGKHVLNYKEEEQDLDDTTFLRYNVIGILFTGSWVPPAKEFMQKLEELYAEVNKTEKIFEIVQISNEKSEHAYKEQLSSKRNWLYLPFNDPFMKNLVEQFNIEFLPTFIVVNRDFFVLSQNGRKDMIDNEGIKSYEKWYKAYRDRKQQLEKEREENKEQLNAES